MRWGGSCCGIKPSPGRLYRAPGQTSMRHRSYGENTRWSSINEPAFGTWNIQANKILFVQNLNLCSMLFAISQKGK